jgi:LysR family cyn operon transcriptional activator
VTQPTLSHQIRQLEDELGCEILERSARQIRLTSAGEIFSEFAIRAIREVEGGLLAIQEFRGLRRGTLKFGVISSFINSLLPPVLSRFQNEYPGIHLKVLELPTGELEQRVREGELAFGVAYGPTSIDHVVWQTLFIEEFAMVVASQHPMAKAKAVAFVDIAEIPLVLLPREYISRKMIDSCFVEALMTPIVRIEMSSIDAILKMVQSSGLATVLTRRMAKSIPGLVSVPIRPSVVRSAGIMTRDGVNLSPAAKIIVKMMVEAYRADSSLPFRKTKKSM